MQTASAYPQIRLCVISPPYEELQPVSVESVEQISRARFGTLACIEICDPGVHWIVLSECIREVRSRCLSVPLVLRLPECVAGVPLDLVRRAGLLRIRAVLREGNGIYEELRAQMTDPVNLGEQVREWLSLRIPALTPPAIVLLGHLFDTQNHRQREPGQAGFQSRLVAQGRKALRQAALPPPRTWRRVARALLAALLVQANPEARLSDVATGCGYSEQASMSNQVLESFELRPTAIRHTLGWEWLMDRWCVRLSGQRPTEDQAI